MAATTKIVALPVAAKVATQPLPKYKDDGILPLDNANATSSIVAPSESTTQQMGVAPEPPCYGGAWTVTEGDDLEYDYARVKRRRVSVEPSPSPLQTTNEASMSQPSWHDQLQEAASILLEPAQETLMGEQPLCQNPKNNEEGDLQSDREASRSAHYSQPTLKTSSTTLQTGPAEAFVHHLPQTDGPMDDPPLKRTKASTLARQKTLQSNGKLEFSSTISPRRSPRSARFQQSAGGNAPNRPSGSFKKVEMKNGRFVSSLRVALSYTSPRSGATIDEILSGRPPNGNTDLPIAEAPVRPSKVAPSRATHPFFRTKGALEPHSRPSGLGSAPPSVIITTDEETSKKQNPKPAKPWKDIVSGFGKPGQQIIASQSTIWPPLLLQHVRPSEERRPPASIQASTPRRASKLKENNFHLQTNEDILSNFSRSLYPEAGRSTPRTPGRIVMSGTALSEKVGTVLEMNNATHSTLGASLEARIMSTPSCFDRGMAAGPHMWVHEYAPTCSENVLESQTKVLHDWLSKLQVHQVQSGKLHKTKAPTPKKQRRKGKSDEMDDFIAHSDDEDPQLTASGKNAILLTGPPGSGKTAAVFAVAEQLGFEVFEIHPGMRRSGRDIQEKIGDVTQNHLVHPPNSLSRESSASIDERSLLTQGPLPANQKILAGVMKSKHQKLLHVEEQNDSKLSTTNSQKQSLILFEEVENLFEDDKGFWNQIQHLNRTSKRPLIMTCNDIDSIPFDDLDLFAVLHYKPPDLDVAIQHLARIAAAEGHLLSKAALRSLFLTKGQDLRSCITELNLWCQMTVGSRQGGLDWMLPFDKSGRLHADGSVTRIVSQDTYTSGLDLLPEHFADTEDLIRFAQDTLGISPSEWVTDDVCEVVAFTTPLQALTDMLTIFEVKSALDLFDETTSPIFAATMTRLPTQAAARCLDQRDEVVRLYLNTLTSTQLTRTSIASAFEPLLEESRISLPTAPGRKAASLDNPSSKSIITDIGPYVRSIVSHDKRLEQLRHELHLSSQQGHGPNKRQRQTRAARAAMEGG